MENGPKKHWTGQQLRSVKAKDLGSRETVLKDQMNMAWEEICEAVNNRQEERILATQCARLTTISKAYKYRLHNDTGRLYILSLSLHFNGAFSR